LLWTTARYRTSKQISIRDVKSADWGLPAHGAGPAGFALPIYILLGIGIAWASIAFIAIVRWSSARNWSDEHCRALVFGAIVASMLAGFGAERWLPIDLIGKVILNAISVVWMVCLASRFRPPFEA